MLRWTLLGTVMVAPWLFACALPLFELYLTYAVVAMFTLWCGLLVFDDRLLLASVRNAGLPWICLLVLTAAVAVPLLPMPSSLAAAISPATERWTSPFQPAERERLKVLAASATVLEQRKGLTAELSTETAQPIALPQSRLLSGPISLNPSGNLQMLMRLTALCILFLVVASFRKPESTLRQLAWAATLVGSALALVALLQSVAPTLSRHIYGVFETPGGYGPFVNKNHYPFFANLALGLTLGLLFERWSTSGLSWGTLFHDPTALWLLMAIALQSTSMAMALSRGGITVLLVSATLCIALRAQGSRGLTTSTLAIVLLVGMGVGLMSWAGFNALDTRLAMLGDADAYIEDGRWYFWSVTLQVFREFPWFGSGGETFRYWETVIQSSNVAWNSAQSTGQRADNELLDILCEYGIFASLAVLGLAVSLLYGVFSRLRSSGLLAGAALGLLCVSLHSLLDFGLRIPATAVFATAVAALAYGARRRPIETTQRTGEAGPTGNRASWRQPLASLIVICGVLGFSYQLLQYRQRYALADQQMLAAYEEVAHRNVERVEAHLQAMIEATPEEAAAHIDYARIALLAAHGAKQVEERERLIEQMLVHCVQARDLCPMVWESPFWISQYVDRLVDARRIDYLRMAHRLHPSNATISFQAGDAELEQGGDFDAAVLAWADSLRYSPTYIPQIVERCVPRLSPEEFVERLLPAQGATLVKAADALAAAGYPDSVPLVLQRAAQAIDDTLPQSDARERQALYPLAARIQARLGEFADAVDFQRKAVRLDPLRVATRLPLVEYLLQAERLREASSELKLIDRLEPNNAQAKKLKQRIFDIENPRLNLDK